MYRLGARTVTSPLASTTYQRLCRSTVTNGALVTPKVFASRRFSPSSTFTVAKTSGFLVFFSTKPSYASATRANSGWYPRHSAHQETVKATTTVWFASAEKRVAASASTTWFVPGGGGTKPPLSSSSDASTRASSGVTPARSSEAPSLASAPLADAGTASDARSAANAKGTSARAKKQRPRGDRMA